MQWKINFSSVFFLRNLKVDMFLVGVGFGFTCLQPNKLARYCSVGKSSRRETPGGTAAGLSRGSASPSVPLALQSHGHAQRDPGGCCVAAEEHRAWEVHAVTAGRKQACPLSGGDTAGIPAA